MDDRIIPQAYRKMVTSPHGEVVMSDLFERFVLHSPPGLSPEAAMARRDLVVEIFEMAQVGPKKHLIKFMEENDG